MKTTKLDQIEPGNPFLSDLFHMGVRMGTNCVVMHSKHDSEEQPYLIICDTKTGERLRVDITEEAEQQAAKSDYVDSLLHEKAGLAPPPPSSPKDEVSREELRETLAIAVALIKTQQADIAYLGSMLKAYVANTLGQFVN